MLGTLSKKSTGFEKYPSISLSELFGRRNSKLYRGQSEYFLLDVMDSERNLSLYIKITFPTLLFPYSADRNGIFEPRVNDDRLDEKTFSSTIDLQAGDFHNM